MQKQFPSISIDSQHSENRPVAEILQCERRRLSPTINWSWIRNRAMIQAIHFVLDVMLNTLASAHARIQSLNRERFHFTRFSFECTLAPPNTSIHWWLVSPSETYRTMHVRGRGMCISHKYRSIGDWVRVFSIWIFFECERKAHVKIV